ncbi:hypothetical protein CABS01_16668 [Colletotrichum abscissum]|uniref:uncharacterized protein n=1 Tax=Colletotrichum abscissum TaxID=1671311 RepID=UPI0027D5ED9A|nr:uncharacterized protein CABS01_16668 [Colletotrichum abscissum]KAK1517379.1 hypothetical protein CABS01_16668 [Colletotrichum abscissum]
MASVYTRQPSDVKSSSMALREQMFSGCGNEGPTGHSAQMCPICLHTAFMNSGGCDPVFLYPAHNCYCGWCAGCGSYLFKPVEHSTPSGYCAESTHLETGYTNGYLTAAADSAHAVADEPLHPWVYGFDGQPIPQQESVLDNGGDWGVAGESLGPTTVPSSTFPGQIIALNG